MDLNEMKNRLSAMQSKQGKGGNGDKKNNFYKPSVGKQMIRIVPNKFNKKNPFTELYIHYGIDNKTMISPSNWGDKDPIIEFAKQLRQTNDKENWKLAKKLEPKMRVFAPVIVRGQEHEGVKLWQFGKELYMDFLNLADNEDVGDFTDIAEGRDIVVTTVGPDVTGTAYNKSTIMPRTKQTPIADDKALIKKLLEEQSNPIDTFKKYSFDEMKQALQAWLAPEAEEGEIIDDEKEEDLEDEVAPWETPKSSNKKNYSLEVKNKPSKADQFDSLFDDEDED